MLSIHRTGRRRFLRRPAAWLGASAGLLSGGLLLAFVSGAAAAPTAVSLGTAQSFAVLAGSGITNTGPTTLNGDLGTYPTTSFTNTGLLTVNGVDHGGDGVTQGAQSDLIPAYNAVRDEGPTSPIAQLGSGQTLLPGVYNSGSTIGLSGALTLDGNGDPNAVFVFQAGSALTTASSSQVNLINGAQSCNVFWQIGSDATLGTSSSFVGNLIAMNSVTVTTGVTVDGRVLARNGAVTLDTDTITPSVCASTDTTDTVADTTTTVDSTTTAGTTTPTAATPTPAGTTPASNATVAPTATLGLVDQAPTRVTAVKTPATKTATNTRLNKAATARKLLAAKRLAAAKALAAKNKLAAQNRHATVARHGATSSTHSFAQSPVAHVGLTG